MNAPIRIPEIEHQMLRLDLYKTLLLGMTIRGDFDPADPKAAFCRAWRLAGVATEVKEQGELV